VQDKFLGRADVSGYLVLGLEALGIGYHDAESVKPVGVAHSRALRNGGGRLPRMVGVVRGILKDQITKGTKTSRVGVRNDAADRDLLHNLAKHLELGGTLVSIQQPIHVSVLDKFEQSFAGAFLQAEERPHYRPAEPRDR